MACNAVAALINKVIRFILNTLVLCSLLFCYKVVKGLELCHLSFSKFSFN